MGEGVIVFEYGGDEAQGVVVVLVEREAVPVDEAQQVRQGAYVE